MRRIVLIVAVLMIAGAAWAERSAWDDWYGMLEFRSAMLYDMDAEEWASSVTAPIVGWRAVALELGGTISETTDGDLEVDDTVLTALTYRLGDLSDLGVSVSWAKYFTFNPGVYARVDWRSMDMESWGFMLNVLDLSFDQGNADAQKEDVKAAR